MSIHAQTHIGYVHYQVAEIERMVRFYQEILGFALHRQDNESATLGTPSRELLRFTKVPGARPARRSTGLYHTAFLVPTRWELAHLVQRIAQTRTPVQGTSNHGTHLAIYLPDPEGNGIELAWDTPADQWPMRDGRLMFEEMPREPVDLKSLLKELERDRSAWNGLDTETIIGHVHLHVSDLERSEHFYAELLGFDVTMKSDAFAGLFVSAGGYHHHIGLNVWHGVGAPPPLPDATGLKYFTIDVPNDEALNRAVARLEAGGFKSVANEEGRLFADPSGIGVMLRRGV